MQINKRFNSIKRAIVVWIDQKRLSDFVLIFVVGVLIFGFSYSLLTPLNQGIASTTTPATQITPWTSIYFSVVTVSTLGYGDIVPQGLSKAIACLEVIFGPTMMGIIVAKLTSGRLSYHVRRLFRSDTQKRLEVYLSAFEIVRKEFAQLSPRIGAAFQETPASTVSPLRAECAAAFGRELSDFNSRSLNFCREINYELEQGDFFFRRPN